MMNGKLSKLIERVLGEDFSNLREMGDLRETDIWDSLIYVTLVVSIEKEFKIQLTKEEIQTLTTIDNITRVLKSRGFEVDD